MKLHNRIRKLEQRQRQGSGSAIVYALFLAAGGSRVVMRDGRCVSEPEAAALITQALLRGDVFKVYGQGDDADRFDPEMR